MKSNLDNYLYIVYIDYEREKRARFLLLREWEPSLRTSPKHIGYNYLQLAQSNE